MPTFSAIQLDRLLESGGTTTTVKTTSLKKKDKVELLKEDSFRKLERRNTTSLPVDDLNSPVSRRSVDIPPPHPQLRRRNSVSNPPPQYNNGTNVTVRPQISPALYTTPEPTPLPVSPTSSFPPLSPFIINHKRRGPRLSKSFSEQNVAAASTSNLAEVGRTRSLSEENVPPVEQSEGELIGVTDKVNGGVVEEATATATAAVDIGRGNGGTAELVVVEEEKEAKPMNGTSWEREGGESEDFFDPQESMSFSSSIDTDDCGGERSAKASTPLGDPFYDAWEELSSDSGRQGAQRSLGEVESELREMRLTLLMEIEKRKHVEETVHSMRTQWQMLREKLGDAGLALPADLAVLGEDSQSDASPTEDICRQIHVARCVSESIGRGIAKAEVEAEMEAQLEAKNFEIARLFDRLHYYETMNREMSQRNQEAVEVARRDRQKRRRRQKWVWGSIATAIMLGSAALAWSYLPGAKGSSSSSQYHEASKSDSDVQ